jgi:hypothetical protein
MPQADKLDHEAFDEYLDAQVVLPYKDIATTGKRVKRIAMVRKFSIRMLLNQLLIHGYYVT